VAPRRALLQQLRRCWARGDGMPPRLPLYPIQITVNKLPQARLRTPRPTTTPSPSKPPLFQYGTFHDDKTVARTARTTANSAALHAILPHVAKQCGMLVIHPSLVYKRKVTPLAAGDMRGHRETSERLSSTLPRYWHPPQSLHQGLGGHASSPALLIAAPLQAPRCKAIQCLEHTTAGRTVPAGTRIKPVSLVA
jgi:hypothetical protein